MRDFLVNLFVVLLLLGAGVGFAYPELGAPVVAIAAR